MFLLLLRRIPRLAFSYWTILIKQIKSNQSKKKNRLKIALQVSKIAFSPRPIVVMVTPLINCTRANGIPRVKDEAKTWLFYATGLLEFSIFLWLFVPEPEFEKDKRCLVAVKLVDLYSSVYTVSMRLTSRWSTPRIPLSEVFLMIILSWKWSKACH